LNALGRLLAVGSKWGSYAAPVAGSGRRAVAREVAEEASEQLGRHGARQAARGAADQTFSRFMSKAELQIVQETGKLRGGRRGETYFTVNRYRTVRSAMRYLSLPNPPEVRLDFKILNQPRIYGPRVAEPKYGQPGGGTELWTVNQEVLVRIIRIVELEP
jgi:hypothetical protein